ncbi:MAG: Gfo/Idh/MocA family oxidoreductase, partial [Actinomycetota bacterium]|nr:Gfo/Idh/MocA family oxidoreductase [Actinomycetota bacterium]
AEGARAAVVRLGAQAAAGSAEELLASDVDVVHICTPNHLHAPLAEQALRAGKHVVCEKPLATSLDDAERLAALAQDSGCITAVPFVYRYYPTVREARSRITAGEAGQLWMLHGSYLQDWLSSQDESNWRVDPALGGASRAFADIGVHWCDLMEFTTGHRITRVSAVMATAFQQRRTADGTVPVGTEDGATVVFETDRGAVGNLVVSQVTPGRKNRLWFSFDGQNASYVFDQENPEALWIGGRRENRVVPRGPETLAAPAAAYAILPSGHPQGYQDSFSAFVADVYDAIGGTDPDGLPRFADGLRAARITSAVVESARSRTWVEVPS